MLCAPSQPTRYRARTVVPTAGALQPGGDRVAVLGERGQGDPAFYRDPVVGQVVGEDALDVILRQRDEAVGHVRRDVERQPPGLRPVDVGDLAPQLHRGVQRLPHQPHRRPDLQRPGLDAHRFREVQGRIEPVDDAAGHTPPVQFDSGGQADRPGSDHENVCLDVHGPPFVADPSGGSGASAHRPVRARSRRQGTLPLTGCLARAHTTPSARKAVTAAWS